MDGLKGEGSGMGGFPFGGDSIFSHFFGGSDLFGGCEYWNHCPSDFTVDFV